MGKRLILLLACILPLFSESWNMETREVRLSLVPRRAGSVDTENTRWYFAASGNAIQIITDAFEPLGSTSLPSRTAAYFLGSLDKQTLSLFEFSGTELRARDWNGRYFGQPRILARNSFAPPPNLYYAEWIDFSSDFDLDGDPDFILPHADGKYVIYENRDGELVILKEIPVNAPGTFSDRLWKNSEQRSNTIKTTREIPRIQTVDINGDGYMDLSFREKEVCTMYMTEPGSSRNPPEYFKNRTSFVLPVNFSSLYNQFSELSDLDGDGDLDLLLSLVKGLGLEIRTEIHIFWNEGHGPSPYFHTSQNFKGGFFSAFPVLGGNKAHLMLPMADINVNFFAGYILQRKIGINVTFLSPKISGIERSTAYPFTFFSEGMQFPAFAMADLNQDGNSDFLAGTTPRQLLLYPGNSEMRKEKPFELNIPSYGLLRPLPVRGDYGEVLAYMPEKIADLPRDRLYLIRVKKK